MAYTFWHAGILIGESELEPDQEHPNHFAGIFRPTAYGLELFPRLSGFLSAGFELKEYLVEKGLDPESLDSTQVEDALENSSGGRRVLDLGRTLSNVEVRSPQGATVEFATIGFSDVDELRTLIREMDVDQAPALPEVIPDSERYIVSFTLPRNRVAQAKPMRAMPFGRRRRWNEDN